MDRTCFPFPAIRYKEYTNELIALREKERGDWRKLSCEEKKTLYRTSFRQTFAEMEAPTGKWKTHLGRFLLNISLALWLFMGYLYFIEREFPESLCERKRRAVLRRQLLLRDNPITGYPAAWDYEADDWKKNVKNKGS
ncbi:UNVERIFIED_CONTAM: hypothetical protein PYX00_006839 [Menopon gallinae]|uniref:Cytochrome c oxidase subunit 4 n=1 Tax=Menopon gallinae TaxID=328185 RepID=A0AAW2HX12_9NEOP